MAKSTAEESPMLISDSQSGSVSEWVSGLKEGDAAAAQQLWNRYFEKLIVQATKRIRSHNCPEGTVVPEDIAVSVFESIWKGANAGRFQNVTDRDELWWLLQAMTRRKVVDHIRHATAARRFPGSVTVSLSGIEPGAAFSELVSDEPTGECILMMEEQYSYLLGLLRDAKLRQIAVLRIEGCSIDEIRTLLKVSSATMTRKLKLIRDTWQQAIQGEGSDDGDAGRPNTYG